MFEAFEMETAVDKEKCKTLWKGNAKGSRFAFCLSDIQKDFAVVFRNRK